MPTRLDFSTLGILFVATGCSAASRDPVDNSFGSASGAMSTAGGAESPVSDSASAAGGESDAGGWSDTGGEPDTGDKSDTDGGPMTSVGPMTSAGPGTSAGPDSGTSDGQPTGGEVRFDVGGASDEAGSPACDPNVDECGCTGVDIIFSVDVSASQQSVLGQMRDQFPSFIDVMLARLPPDVELHIGVTTASFGPSAFHSDAVCGFDDGAFSKPPPSVPQLYTPPTAGMVMGNGTQGRLWSYGGKHFFSANTSDADLTPLKDWFTGVTNEVVNVSTNRTYGDAELSAAAAAWAFHPISQVPGFIRDQGTVTVLFLTGDADHSYYVEDAQFLHDTVVAAKAGCGGNNCIIGAGMLKGDCMDGDPVDYAGFDFLRSFGEEPIWGDAFADPDEWRRVLGDALAQFVVDTCATIPPPAD